MKRLFGLLTIAAFLTAVPVSHIMVGNTPDHKATFKGHVPANMVQVCAKGEARVVSRRDAKRHLKRADTCQLPACDFNNVFLAGDACPGDANGDNLCDVANARDDACGVSAGCPAGSKCY